MLTVPKPVAEVESEAGEKEVITSDMPAVRLPALATNIRLLLGKIAPCVGFSMFDPLGSFEVAAITLSPETSICMAVPGKNGTFVLSAKTS